MPSSVLILTEWFYPGKKAGGPIRSVVNFVQHFKDQLEISVITGDRDLHEADPYKNILFDEWGVFQEGVKVKYLSPPHAVKKIHHSIKECNPDFLYLQSMFSFRFTIIPIIISQLISGQQQIVLAPRGMLKASALSQKKKKKMIFLFLFKLLSWHRRIIFHATNEEEVHDVKKIFGSKVKVFKASNLPSGHLDAYQPIDKSPSALKLFFLGRIHPIKNLHLALQFLHKLSGNIELDIFGPSEHAAYLEQCKTIVAGLPKNIKVKFCGILEPEEVPATIIAYHALLLPTQGENFGHAIFECLQAGRPVIISDQTPWRELNSKEAGWDLALKEEDLWTASLNQLSQMDQLAYDSLSRGARIFAETFRKEAKWVNDYMNIFSEHNIS